MCYRTVPVPVLQHHTVLTTKYNQDDDAGQAACVKRLKTKLTEVHGLLFVTPEYNRSIPGVLNNAMGYASHTYGLSAQESKPARVMGVPTLGQPEAFSLANDDFFDTSGSIGEACSTCLQGGIDHTAAWVRKSCT